MELQSVIEQMIKTSQKIDIAINERYRCGRKKADTERDYREALSKEIARLRVDGVPTTIVKDLAKGNVLDLMHERDLADVLYKSANESMKALRSQLNGLQTVSKYQSDTGG